MILTRRTAIISGLGALAASSISPVSFAAASTPRRLLFIIQRGAADGLSLVAPTGDPNFSSARGALAEDSEGGARLDGMFTLHPALSNVAKLFQSRQAHFAHAVSTIYRDRSHFDGQNILESGARRPYGLSDGWINRMLTLLPAADQDALAIADAIPLAMRGSMPVATYAPSRLPQADADLMARISALYANDSLLHPLWESAVATQDLVSDIGDNIGRKGEEIGGMAASLMAPKDGARVMMIETGGWDTHSGQRARLAAQLRGLDGMIGAFQKGLGGDWVQTLVIVATEFGRTVEINGTGGTDHGTASTAMFLGGALAAGGKVSADWPGLAPAMRQDGRDLKPTRSLESAISDAIAHHYALDPARVMEKLYPDT